VGVEEIVLRTGSAGRALDVRVAREVRAELLNLKAPMLKDLDTAKIHAPNIRFDGRKDLALAGRAANAMLPLPPRALLAYPRSPPPALFHRAPRANGTQAASNPPSFGKVCLRLRQGPRADLLPQRRRLRVQRDARLVRVVRRGYVRVPG
jgi:hypothetical protein